MISFGTAEELIARWERNEAGPSLVVPVGSGSDGSVAHVNLTFPHHGGNGCHGFVQGSCGAGKTTQIKNMLINLAFNYSPSKVVFVIFEAGSEYADLDSLPHVIHRAGNLVGEKVSAYEQIRYLRDSSYSREDMLKAMGHRDIETYRKSVDGTNRENQIPYVFVVVDYPEMFVNESPELLQIMGSDYYGYRVILSTYLEKSLRSDLHDAAKYRLLCSERNSATAIINFDSWEFRKYLVNLFAPVNYREAADFIVNASIQNSMNMARDCRAKLDG